MSQVDRLYGPVSSAAIKVPCRAATTTNITLSAAQTIDGVAAVTGDRVLVKDQTDQTENGIWEVDSGDWSRTQDFDGAYDVVLGTLVLVTNGTTNGNTYWRQATANPITIDTSNLTFEAALVDDSALASYEQAGTGAVTQSVQGRLRKVFFSSDYATIAQAQAACLAAGGGTVCISSGTYTEQVTYVDGVRLEGAGKTVTIIRPTAGANKVGISISGINEWDVRHLKIDMALCTGNSDGLRITSCSRGMAEQLLVVSATRAGVRLVTNGYGNNLTNVVSNSNLYGLEIAGTSSSDLVTALHADTCWFQSNTSHGVYVKNGGLLTFTGCVSELNTGSGLKLETFATHLNWIGGTIEANTRYACETDATYESIVIDGYHDAVGGLGLYSALFVNRDIEAKKGDIIASTYALIGANIRGLWVFDESSGTTISDKGPNGNTFTFSTDIKNLSPRVRNVKQYIDITTGGYYADAVDSANFTFGNGAADSAFSIVMLVKPGNTADAVLAGKFNGTFVAGQQIEYNFSFTTALLGVRLFDASVPSYIGRKYNTSLVGDTSSWHVYVMTYSGSSAASGILIYRDGTRIDDTNDNSGAYTAMEDTTAKFGTLQTFGGVTDNGKAAYGYLGIFAEELTASKVKALTSLLSSSVGNRN